jgi:AcrR family transcriptional regulator
MRQQNPRGQGGKLHQDILAAAFAVLDENGTVEAVKLRAVARMAGVTAPAIYGHFASVDELVAKMRDIAFEELLATTDAAAAGADGPVAALLARSSAYVELGISAPARRRLLFTPITDRVNEVGLATFDGLVDLVRECVAAGRSTSKDPQKDTAHLLAALDGLVLGHTVLTGFPWPPLDEAIHDVTMRLALID